MQSTRRKTHRLLCICTILITIILFSVLTNVQADTADFLGKVGHPIKYVFVSTLTDEEIDQFIEYAEKADDTGIIDKGSPIHETKSADVLLFLLNSWEEATILPWQDSFSEAYEKVSGLESSEPVPDAISIEVLIDGGRPYMLVFYNMSIFPEKDLGCYAISFVALFQGPEAKSISSHQDCNKS